MSAMIPMAMFGLEVPCGDVMIPATSDIPSAFRITMAAIDPSAEAEPTDDPNAVPRATLKVIRQALVDFDSDDEDDEEDEDDFDINELEAMLGGEEDDEESDDEDVNGGPSDPARSKKAKKAAAQKAIMQLLAEQGSDDEDDMELDDAPNGKSKNKKSAKALGKMPASDEDDDEDDEDSDDEEGEIEEFVICTLDPAKNYQQPIDITIGENERVFFKVSGTHTIYLTGNYVEPAHDHEHGPGGNGMYDPDSDDEDDYDLEPNSDEEIDYDSEDDELDDMEDPRITEVEDEEEAPKLIKAEKKGKNKRPAEEDAAASIDELIAKAEEKPLSKKQLKKLKKNDGSATETKTEEPVSASKSDKKVSFAKQLEQGPTPTKADANKAAPESKKSAVAGAASSGPRVVQGVTIDDKKLGSGPAAKAGDKVGMRYIGKLEKDGKVFDSNKKGKPFSFKLGVGEVIKGWDIGVAGMTAGGERRITIPAHLGYGKQGTGPIPGNATLVFDVKLLSVAKK